MLTCFLQIELIPMFSVIKYINHIIGILSNYSEYYYFFITYTREWYKYCMTRFWFNVEKFGGGKNLVAKTKNCSPKMKYLSHYALHCPSVHWKWFFLNGFLLHWLNLNNTRFKTSPDVSVHRDRLHLDTNYF